MGGGGRGNIRLGIGRNNNNRAKSVFFEPDWGDPRDAAVQVE